MHVCQHNTCMYVCEFMCYFVYHPRVHLHLSNEIQIRYKWHQFTNFFFWGGGKIVKRFVAWSCQMSCISTHYWIQIMY